MGGVLWFEGSGLSPVEGSTPSRCAGSQPLPPRYSCTLYVSACARGPSVTRTPPPSARNWPIASCCAAVSRATSRRISTRGRTAPSSALFVSGAANRAGSNSLIGTTRGPHHRRRIARLQRLAQEIDAVLLFRLGVAIDDQHRQRPHHLDGEVLPIVAGQFVLDRVVRRPLLRRRIGFENHADQMRSRLGERLREGERHAAILQLCRVGRLQIADEAAIDFQADAMRRRVGFLTVQIHRRAKDDVAAGRSEQTIGLQRRQRPVGRIGLALRRDVDHPEARPELPGRRLRLVEPQLAGQKRPAKQAIAVGPAEALAIAEKNDFALGTLAARQDDGGLLQRGAPIAAAGRRGQFLDVLARRAPDRGSARPAPARPALSLAGWPRCRPASGRRRTPAPIPSLSRAVCPPCRSIPCCRSRRKRARHRGWRRGAKRARLERGEERSRQGQHQHGNKAHAQQHEQQFLNEQPAPRHLAELQELHGAPVHHLVATAIEQMDDGGNEDGRQTNKHPRIEEKGTEHNAGFAGWEVVLSFSRDAQRSAARSALRVAANQA